MISISGISPSPGEKSVSINSAVEFVLTDTSNIDISTLNVEFAGYYAILNGVIQDPFVDDSQINVVDEEATIYLKPDFDLDIGKVYGVDVHIQSADDLYFHKTYSFKTTPQEPVLTLSSPENNALIHSPQVIYLEFEDVIHGVDKDSLNIWINNLLYIEEGQLVSGLHGALSRVTQEDNKLFVRIDLLETLRDKKYIVRYQVSDPGGYELDDKLSFDVELKEAVLSNLFPQITFLGYNQGINKVINTGEGDSVLVTWNKLVKRSYQTDAFVLIYKNESRLNIFDRPQYIAFDGAEDLTISGLVSGQPLSFAARALEITSGILTSDGMTQVDDGVYVVPNPVELILPFSSDDYQISVSSTEGYPDKGILLLGNEVIKYTSVDRDFNIFRIPVNGRGLLNTVPGNFFTGDSIELFFRCTDQNTVIVSSTPTYQDGYNFDMELNYEGFVVTDFTPNDEKFFQGFDFCGWRDDRPDQVLFNKEDCGSYMGGEYNGFRGLNIYDRLLENSEVQLSTVGEPVILLKRIWEGKVCDCYDNRKSSSRHLACNECYGTTFAGGYDQYHYARRSDRRILMSFSESPDSVKYEEASGLSQNFEPNAWTMPSPAIRDRDLILRFDISEKRTFIYEIQNVTRSPIFGRLLGVQNLNLKRIDKTHIVYTYPVDLSTIPDPTGF